jgi:DNA polymerase III subunit gamma/tau
MTKAQNTSETYTVSARKYRPAEFASVVGQAHITNTLKNAIKQNHLAQAFLFCGPRGVGKTTCARILAKTINCTAQTGEGEACNQCESCDSFSKQQSFNFYELDAASNNSVEDIRKLVDQVRFAPQSGKYKTYIIDEVHMLSQSAFNAFLKTLEEPPPYAIFILATTEKQKILPTILSRCQIFDFKRIQIQDIANHLKDICQKEKVEAEEDALYMIAQKADGALRDSLSILDRILSFSGNKLTYQDVIDNLNILDYDYYLKITNFLLDRNIPDAIILLNEIIERGYDLHNFLSGLSRHFRDLLMCRSGKTTFLLEMPENIKKAYTEQAAGMPDSLILSYLNTLNQFESKFKSSKNQRLDVELALMKLCYIREAVSLASNNQASPELKKKAVELNKAESQAKSKIPSENNNEKTDNQSAETETAPANPKNNPVQTDNRKAVSTPKFGNLKDMSAIKSAALKENEKKPPAEKNSEQDVEVKENENTADKTLSEKELIDAWESCKQKFYDKKRINIKTIFDKAQLKAEAPNTLTVMVNNKVLEESFRTEKTNLLSHIKEITACNSVILNCEIIPPSTADRKKYTVSPKAIFKEMHAQNPAIENLVKKLELRIEH